MKKLMMLVVIGLLSGCAVMPESHVRSWNLGDKHTIYFEQADRVPKDVMIEAIKACPCPKTAGAAQANMAAIPPEIIAKIIEEIAKMIPEMSRTYAAERMNEAMIGRRILIKGYDGTNELEQVNEIIKSMSGCIERYTPQRTCPAPEKPVPAAEKK